MNFITVAMLDMLNAYCNFCTSGTQVSSSGINYDYFIKPNEDSIWPYRQLVVAGGFIDTRHITYYCRKLPSGPEMPFNRH